MTEQQGRGSDEEDREGGAEGPVHAHCAEVGAAHIDPASGEIVHDGEDAAHGASGPKADAVREKPAAGHAHGHDHAHASLTDDRKRLVVVLAITFSVMIAEIVGAIWSGSLSLLADAGHMFADASGLLIASIAATLALRPASLTRTWGFRRAEVIAAGLQAGILLAMGVFIVIEAVRRLVSGEGEVVTTPMLVFGAVGLVGNIAGLLVLASRRGNSLNLRAAFLEVLTDALGSVAVIIAAIVMMTTGWTGADSIVSLLIGAFILPRSLKLLRETVDVLLESTPRGLDLALVREHMLKVPHVVEVHDLHASLIGSTTPVLSGHVAIEEGWLSDERAGELLRELQHCVSAHFPVSVEHATFQLEPARFREDEHMHH